LALWVCQCVWGITKLMFLCPCKFAMKFWIVLFPLHKMLKSIPWNDCNFNLVIKIVPSVTWSNHVGWLQGKVVCFLCCSFFFCKVTCIYMLFTWHTNNNFPNLWLDLDCQLEEIYIYKKMQYIHQIYSNELLKLKNMDWFTVCASIYMQINLCMNFIWDIL